LRPFNRGWRRWLLLIPAVLLIAIGAFVAWAGTPSGQLMPEVEVALQSDAAVTVSRERWLTFTPQDAAPATGLILYPGGRVLADAYAPAARELAEAGYLVVIVPMPLNLAVLGVNAASDVIAAYPEIEHWALGGHSLGGAMAANYAKANPGVLDGLVIWASYPQASDTLADFDDLVVASVYGSRDGLAKADDVEGSRQYLPEDATFVEIEGGNHAQFGWYGDQAGDNPAEITREAQQAQVVAATLTVLAAIDPS
jgi:dienelactone hydrolase